MSNIGLSVPIDMMVPTDYAKAWESGQQQYNHQNDCGDPTTLVKQTCYIRDTGKTGIVI